MTKKERFKIENALNQNLSIRAIANILNKAPSTMQREIKKNSIIKRNTKVIILNKQTDEVVIKEHPCSILKKSPYVCNGCPRYINNHCTYHYRVYDSDYAKK